MAELQYEYNNMICPLISIIVPVYNVEKYLGRCLQSVLNQTYKNIEVILINDASTDSSESICKAAMDDSRIVFIDKKRNQGLSSARNDGLRIARGDYVMFVDSDDAIVLNTCDIVMDVFRKTKADMVCFRSKGVRCDELEIGQSLTNINTDYNIKMYSRDTLLDRLSEIWATSWGKVYKRSLFVDNKITFPAGLYHEDEYIFFDIVYCCNTIADIDAELYLNTAGRPGGITVKPISERADSLCKAYNHRVEFTEKNNWEKAKPIAIMNKIYSLSTLCSNREATEEFRLEYREKLREAIKRYKKEVHIPYRYRICARSPFVFYIIKELREKIILWIKSA